MTLVQAACNLAMAGSSSRDGAELTLRIILFCALAAAAGTTTTLLLLPLAMDMDPCAVLSLPRSILAATGLDDAYNNLLSSACAGDASSSESEAPSSSSSQGNDARNNRTGGGGRRARARPVVTDQRCVNTGFQCCPPASASDPINFTFPARDPAEPQPLRTRRPVHVAGDEYVAKYARAVALMKALPESDPRSFRRQADVHCAYCSGAHRQVGFPELGVEIHYSWLFFPFHRAHLYFFERIAAKLLGDPGFALPVWTWDVPEGMGMPRAFTDDEASPLYDPLREPSHAPPKVADLDFVAGEEKNLTDEQQILQNLRLMYKQMVSGAASPSLFFGQPYRGGDPSMPGAGMVELAPHNTMHTWTGDNSLPNQENMGAYYSAGHDPLFYPHHANIDRLWETWCGINANMDLSDPDWLDSSFLFYDEEARLVRITVRDVLHIDKLGYTYGNIGLPPWLSARPPTTPAVNSAKGGGGCLESVRFPVSLLDAAVTVEVRRPRVPRRTRRQEKQEEVEVLLVEGIEVDAGADMVRFDVYVNAREYHMVPPGGREMAGSFITLKQKHPADKERMVALRTSMRLALKELLEDLGAQGNDSVTITLVPVRGHVTIGGLRIVYMHE